MSHPHFSRTNKRQTFTTKLCFSPKIALFALLKPSLDFRNPPELPAPRPVPDSPLPTRARLRLKNHHCPKPKNAQNERIRISALPAKLPNARSRKIAGKKQRKVVHTSLTLYPDKGYVQVHPKRYQRSLGFPNLP